MSNLIRFIRGKTITEGIRLLYLRIGKADPIFDELSKTDEESEIVWELEEDKTFDSLHIGARYKSFGAIALNLEINEENIKAIRVGFWKKFIWKLEAWKIPIAIIIPNSDSPGSISKSQVLESLSLIRMGSNPFQLFEHGSDTIDEILDWILPLASTKRRED